MKPLSVAISVRPSGTGDDPKIGVRDSLIPGPANILDVVAQFAQGVHCGSRYVLVYENPNGSCLDLDGSDLFLRQAGGVVE